MTCPPSDPSLGLGELFEDAQQVLLSYAGQVGVGLIEKEQLLPPSGGRLARSWT